MKVQTLLEKLYRDPLALSRFSQFRYFCIDEGEIVQDLNKNHEFQVCFILKGSLCVFRDQMESMPLMVMPNELFFISSLNKCKIRAMNDVQLVIHASNIVAPYLHSRIVEYLQDITIEEAKPIEVLPIHPLLHSYLELLVDYMKNGTAIPDLHRAKEYELFSLFRICYNKYEIASIFRDTLSKNLQFFVSVMTHYKTCRTAKELANLCGYNEPVFTQLFKKYFHGLTPYQWLQKQTSYEIEFKLRENVLSIKQIMLEYHFKTFSHFTTYCKRNIGATPNEIRKNGSTDKV
ncbi:AraC family transcriptional regulator [Bacteroides helcogenes]|uniref:Helix-turn-helix, AraC domain protein n=1 Tax=Bacteroides helcogenes (strain ATCC 35417 / DSM 20613 / JCM 6297 / CCUG 15421 / P 36-108) TaxID=693979 RepID=E6SS92_BACT6|nr:helix-turn-helix domain-containing protein [Bacteroides helcogenes]ADV44160.1 Helix-turn-helix, AraC domain protein [Bacteroides helcogenes P 36-108]MDY5238427.1 helix-turn-helix domain-containing protein [Bacteroides helcogenes]